MKRFTFLMLTMLMSLGSILAQTDVQFVVKDDGGLAIEGARVKVGYSSGTTDVNGEVTLGLYSGGDYVVTSPGKVDYYSSFVLAEYTDPIQVTLENGYDVTFIMKDEAGNDETYGYVTMDGVEKRDDYNTPGGSVTYGVVPGTYAYEAWKSAYIKVTGSVEVVDQDITVDILFVETTVTFTVWNADMSAKLEGIDVKFNSKTVTTDIDGIAVFSKVGKGTNKDYEIHADGYVSKKVKDTFDVEYDHVAVDATAEEGVLVTLNAYEEDGTTGLEAYATINGFSKTMTGGTAGFWLPKNNPAVDFDYTIQENGYEKITSTVSVGETAVVVNHTMDMLTLQVTVVDELASPVEGATVVFSNTNYLTGADGMTGMIGGSIYASTFEVHVWKDGYADAYVSVDFTAENDIAVTVTLNAGSVVTMVAKDASGNPIQWVNITVDGHTYMTDATGTIYVGLENGTYEYSATDLNAIHLDATGSFTVADANIQVDITMEKVFNLFVFVKDAPDAEFDLSGVTVTVTGTGDNAGYTETMDTYMTMWDGTGAFFYGLAAGTYDITISYTGYDDINYSIDLTQNESKSFVLGQDYNTYDLTFKVAVPESPGIAAYGAVVTLTGNDVVYPSTSVTTDAMFGDPVAVFTGLFVGTYDVVITMDGYPDYVGQVVVAGNATEWIEMPVATAIDDVKEMQVSVYPNPVVDVLNISSESDVVSVKIYNVAGTLVDVVVGDNITQVNMSDLTTGVYIVVVKDNNGTVSTVKVQR